MEEYWMSWMDLKEQQPSYKEVVLITNKEHNELEGEFHCSVGYVNHKEVDERGEYLIWHDNFDSGVKPTHFCRIPKFKKQ